MGTDASIPDAERLDGIVTLRASGSTRSWNGIRYKEGRVRHCFGEGLSRQVDNAAGDFIFIEPGVPHEVYNLSETEPVVAVVARSDASEWEHIVSYPSARRAKDGVA